MAGEGDWMLRPSVLRSGRELCSCSRARSPRHHRVPSRGCLRWQALLRQTCAHTGVVVAAVREPEGCGVCTPESRTHKS